MSRYNKENLQVAVNHSKSIAEVCRYFGVKPSSGSQTHVARRIKIFGISTDHFTGQAWNRGRQHPKKSALEYCFNGSTVQSHKLKLMLIRDGLKEAKCEHCGISEWRDEPVVLELDHIDSNHFNNSFSNLQILCPNCHALKTRKLRSFYAVTGNQAGLRNQCQK